MMSRRHWVWRRRTVLLCKHEDLGNSCTCVKANRRVCVCNSSSPKVGWGGQRQENFPEATRPASLAYVAVNKKRYSLLKKKIEAED